MAEDSMLWTTSGTGDGPGGGYTQQNWIDYHRYIFSPDVEGTQFVLKNKGNKLACTAGASSVNVDTGAAFVYGFFYKNTATVNVAITNPTLGTTGIRVVLRASWAAQTVRAAVIRNSDGVIGIPAATQNPGTTYEVTLATGTITNAGTVTLTDARAFIQPAWEITGSMLNANVADNSTLEVIGNVIREKDGGTTNAKLRNSGALSVIGRSANSSGVPADISASAASGAVLRESGSVLGFGTIATAGIADNAVTDAKAGDRVLRLDRRVGGDPAGWYIQGSTGYTPTGVRMQCGIVASSAGAAVVVNFPVAFSNTPIAVATGNANAYAVVTNVLASSIAVEARDATGARVAGVNISWIAVGPE